MEILNDKKNIFIIIVVCGIYLKDVDNSHEIISYKHRRIYVMLRLLLFYFCFIIVHYTFIRSRSVTDIKDKEIKTNM